MFWLRLCCLVLHHPDFFSAHGEFPDAAHEFTEPPCDSMRSAPRVKRPHAGAWRFCSQVAPQRSHAAFWLRLCCFVGQADNPMSFSFLACSHCGESRQPGNANLPIGGWSAPIRKLAFPGCASSKHKQPIMFGLPKTK